MKWKINKTAIWNLMLFVTGSYFVIESFYMITIKPFLSKQMVGFTPLGLVVFTISLFAVMESGSYLNERINR